MGQEVVKSFSKLKTIKRGPAKYEVIKSFLVRELTSERYVPGDALPSEITLAKTLGVARNTVRQALGELEKEGLVCRLKGKGCYLTEEQGGKKKEYQREDFGLIMPEICEGLYPALVKGFDGEANRTHQQVMVCNTGYDINKQGNIILQMIDKNMAGVAMVPALSPATPAYQVRQLQRNKIPVVFCHRSVPGVSAPLVTWDWKKVGRMAGQAFIEQGHRDIGYFAVSRYPGTEAHEAGLREVLEEAGVNLPEEKVHYGVSPENRFAEEENKRKALDEMINSSQPLTAVFCNDDNQAELIYYLAMEMGIKVPGELSIIGFGNYDRTGVIQRKLTSITVNEFELGARAAMVLHEMRTDKRSLSNNETIYKSLALKKGDTLSSAPD